MTAAVVLLSTSFILFTYSLVDKSQGTELKKAEHLIYQTIQHAAEEADYQTRLSAVYDLPYYLTYIIYEASSGNLIATNNPFLPNLQDTKGKIKHFFQKDYFFDGDLNIIYYASLHSGKNDTIVIAVARNMDNNATAEIFSRLPKTIPLMVIPILILSFFVSLFITKNTIKPVSKITKAAKSITTENLSALLPLSGYDDEIDELSETFNALFQRIKLDFDRERQFSSDVSHELNTPLTVISGQTGLLLRWGKDNPEQLEKSLNAIKAEAKTMQAIIANLLQISRIESGRIKPQLSEINVKTLFRWLMEEFKAIAPDVEIEIESNDIVFQSDSEILHQILTVLISNSVKFSNQKCRIQLKARKENSMIIIEEIDDGPGFSEEALPHIFERFYRADESHTRKIAGSGLGLAIAQTLCTALGAKIKARNVAPHGAGFTIEFPAD